MQRARFAPEQWARRTSKERSLCLLEGLRYARSMGEGGYFTCIVASRSRTLYVGMTSDLRKRVFEHKDGAFEGFSSRYNCNRLMWFEIYDEPLKAINREKQLKGWRREKRLL
jgi:putative endonuclease